MNQTVIHAEGLGKRYRRGSKASTDSLYETFSRILRSPLNAFRRAPQEFFWALRDVSLDVHEGEVLGLIGRNGAGKTTLLKILTRITRPTTGTAEIRGRVRSLLEVGTGFHAELTGRENTYLSGSILGMGKREIGRKFDEIVAFAEIDKFIDTPVKHYSSGMYVRLAFAVAAHLEPEILLVDEVLAVGDINFQKKCLGKMGDVARAGRTVVLVSHQLNQIRRLCSRAVWIDGGNVRQNGPAHEVVSSYEFAMRSTHDAPSTRSDAPHDHARFISWGICGADITSPHRLDHLGPVTVRFHLIVRDHIRHGEHGIALYNAERQLIWGTAMYDFSLEPGSHWLTYNFPTLPLKPGPYSWLVSIFGDRKELDMWEAVPEMVVVTDSYQHHRDEWSGVLNLRADLHVHKTTVDLLACDTTGNGDL